MAFIKRPVKAERVKPTDCLDIIDSGELLGFIDKHQIKRTPLDVSKLVLALGIKMHLEPMVDDDSGSLTKGKNGWVMKVNSLHHPNRQRFTIAHEVAHYIKHRHHCNNFEGKTFFRNGDSNPIETEANRFAAEILMPASDFEHCVKNVSPKVEDIANYFQVSTFAVRLRAKQLHYSGHNL